MEKILNELDKEYNTLAKKVLSGNLSDEEYEKALDTMQEIELEIMKLRLIRPKS